MHNAFLNAKERTDYHHYGLGVLGILQEIRCEIRCDPAIMVRMRNDHESPGPRITWSVASSIGQSSETNDSISSSAVFSCHAEDNDTQQ